MSLSQPSLFGPPDPSEWVRGHRCDVCKATGEYRRRPGQPFEDDWRCACGNTALLSHSRVFGERAEEMTR